MQSWFNELLSDDEIFIREDTFLTRSGVATYLSSNGHYYCGQEVLSCSCCNAICGPSSGCNCQSCQEIEKELKENKDASSASLSSPQEQVQAWTWGTSPTLQELKDFSKLVSQKQQQLFKKSSESCLSMQRLKCKIFIYARFLSIHSMKSAEKKAQQKQSSKPQTDVVK